MATKIPLVISAGRIERLQAGDTLPSSVNALINGGFDFFQRTDPGLLTGRTDDQYGPDRWVILTQTASVSIRRESGDTNSVHAVEMKQTQATMQRMGLLQIIEGVESSAMRGKTVTFQSRVYLDQHSQAIRVAILEWTGVTDTLTSDVVKDWTSSTYTANNFFLASNLTVTAVGTVTPALDTWTDVTVSGTVSASCNNLMVFIWTEAAVIQNDLLFVTEAGLYRGSISQPWSPRSAQQELALCQRYYEKSYDLETPPGSGGGIPGLYECVAWNVNTPFPNVPYKVSKRVAGDPHVYSFANGTIDKVTVYGGGSGDKTVSYCYQALSSFLYQSAGLFTAWDILDYYWTCDAEL